MSPTEKVKYLIENNTTMIIATANADGKPWISPVFFSYDDQFNLYWVSDKKAQHSASVRTRPQVGIVIVGAIPPEDYPDAAYFDAEAIELNNETDIKQGMTALAKRHQADKFVIKTPADASGDACWRIYKATYKEVSKREDDVDHDTGQAITVRMPVKL